MCDCVPLPSLPLKSLSPKPLPQKFNLQLRSIPRNPHNFSFPNSRSASSGPTSPSNPLRDNDDFLDLKRELEKDGDLVPAEGSGGGSGGGLRVHRGRGKRQLMKRSSLLAKQVISVRTARSLGFVSQIWVDTASWMVILVEVRPNLLSGEVEKFLLEDVSQVGDVVLVEDESVLEKELKIIGLDTLVGYNVITSGRHKVGKVRGYTFNINSGAVESLELDSFGVSIIPASLVSTYCLFVKDVLEVASDNVTVQDGAASRVQRVTKGIWDTQNVDKYSTDAEEYYDIEKQSFGPFPSQSSRRSRRHRYPQKARALDDDWELPMDY